MHLLSTVLFLLAADDGGTRHVVSPTPAEATCPVTKPNGIVAGGEQSAPGSFGTREISVGPFGLWGKEPSCLSQGVLALSLQTVRSA